MRAIMRAALFPLTPFCRVKDIPMVTITRNQPGILGASDLVMMYQCVKDFAGPFATIVAAIAAVIVTTYFNRQQTKIAQEQANIANQKLRHDIFERQYERRYRIYCATRNLLARICRDGNVSDEDLRTYIRGTNDSVFLFDDDLPHHLGEIHNRAVAMQTFKGMIDTFPPGDKKRENCIAQSQEHFEWLVHQLEGLPDKFKPFLKLSEFRFGS